MRVKLSCAGHPKGHMVEAVYAKGGLAVTPWLAKCEPLTYSKIMFAVTHVKSGRSAGSPHFTKRKAMELLETLLPMRNWTIGEKEILKSIKRNGLWVQNATSAIKKAQDY